MLHIGGQPNRVSAETWVCDSSVRHQARSWRKIELPGTENQSW
jgi:hypothetical protein